jgi:hypothetical protein
VSRLFVCHGAGDLHANGSRCSPGFLCRSAQFRFGATTCEGNDKQQRHGRKDTEGAVHDQFDGGSARMFNSMIAWKSG